MRGPRRRAVGPPFGRAVNHVAPRPRAAPGRDGARDIPGADGGPGCTPLYTSDTDRDGDFDGAVADPQVVAEAWETWRAEVAFATSFVAEAPNLDVTADDSQNKHGSGGGATSLREMLLGTIEEYARHMGHADLLRERIDGRIGQ